MATNTVITAGQNGTATVQHVAAGATAGIPVIAYAAILMIILAVGLVIIFIARRKKAKNIQQIPIKIFIPTSSGLSLKLSIGVETADMTQRMIDFSIDNLKRRIKMPPPSSFVYGTLFLLQISDVEFRPLVLHTEKTTPYAVKDILKRISKKTPDKVDATGAVIEEGKFVMEKIDLSTEERQALIDYMGLDQLVPVIDPAFAISYAHNVEKIIEATAVEANDFWAKLSKFMPAIIIVVTVVAAVIVLYGLAQFEGATYGKIAGQLAQGLVVKCQLPNATVATTTIKPPAI